MGDEDHRIRYDCVPVVCVGLAGGESDEEDWDSVAVLADKDPVFAAAVVRRIPSVRLECLTKLARSMAPFNFSSAVQPVVFDTWPEFVKEVQKFYGSDIPFPENSSLDVFVRDEQVTPPMAWSFMEAMKNGAILPSRTSDVYTRNWDFNVPLRERQCYRC